MQSRKVCILGTANLKHMTLISLYTQELKKSGIDYDIIYIDKYHEVEQYDARKLYRFELSINSGWPFPIKLVHYWTFRKFAINLIDEEKYDFIIVWNEFTAFMFSDYLKRKYPNRYCINIRDQNYNNNPLCQMRYKEALSKSCFSTISSERFREVYPKADYLFIHSYNKELISDLHPVQEKRKPGEPIRVTFIGRMSYPESMKHTIDALGNDDRFTLSLIGAGCEIFESYIHEKGYSNIVLHGTFNPKETLHYLNDTDVIYSLNKENDIHSDTLLPIKLYYAIGKHIPILVYKSSYTYDYAKRHYIDIGVESIDLLTMGDVIYQRYSEMKQDDIDKGCESAMKEIEESHRELKKRIDKYIVKNPI